MTLQSAKNTDRIPEPTLRRLPWYLSCAKLMREKGEKFVSSTQISRQINIDASQIAKDFTNLHCAYLFGVGSLGGALLRDSGLAHFGLKIVGAFDIKPQLVGTNINGIPIYHSDEFEARIQADRVNIGVLTVPISIAQEITDKMVAGGIKAVWNFTPFRIRVPERIVVQNTSLYAHLAVMFNRLNEIND